VLDRWYADWRLLQSGLRKAGMWNPVEHSAAVVYWTAVRVGGSFCFHYGKKRDEVDLENALTKK
jgi:hypothetical protein